MSNEIAELWRAWPGIPFQPGTGILGCGPGAGHAVPVEVPPDSGRIGILGPVELVGEEPVVPFAFTGGTIDRVVVDVSGEEYIDYEKEVLAFLMLD